MTRLPKSIHLKDYRIPSHRIHTLHLTFDIHIDFTIVTNVGNYEQCDHLNVIRLNGEHLELMLVSLDDRTLSVSEYELDDHFLTIKNLPKSFVLRTVCRIYPHKNYALEGLYRSKNIYCTQNEPEGFRKITYHLDRPDVMSIYKTTIIADQDKEPILLSNGNLIQSINLDNNRHSVTWEDPFKKPSYLFALVAGDLACKEDSFTTRSGRIIPLRIYVDKGNEHRTDHAFDSLKKAMKWDENTFDLEYDLDIFMIVAVDAFNFGAMENKGLNIFNSSAVLADPRSSTDDNYERIESIVAHEYFHNWTGNRVTCRDWFQITLKEGLTVFRDQEFTADMTDKTVKRIKDVKDLREYQFPEDMGPTSHPIRPLSYIQINNFYTSTVYEKGAEVIRMIHTLIGSKKFKQGIKKYFELYDGKAVTTDDFIHAMEVVSNRSFDQFKRWYSTAGTPNLKCTTSYEGNEVYSIRLTQTCTHPPNQSFEALHIPIKIGFVTPEREMAGQVIDVYEDHLLELTKMDQTFKIKNVPKQSIISILRDFSAPVIIENQYEVSELKTLYKRDSNLFNRYNAGQSLLKKMIYDYLHNGKIDLHEMHEIGDILKGHLENQSLDPAYRAVLLEIPSIMILSEGQNEVDFYTLHSKRKEFIKKFMSILEKNLKDIYFFLMEKQYNRSKISINKRKLKNICLAYLFDISQKYCELIFEQFKNSDNMTDTLHSLFLLCQTDNSLRKKALDQFLEEWRHDPLVMNKWFMVQAMSTRKNTIEQVKILENHSEFDRLNPNKLRSLFGVFVKNLPLFHHPSGNAYKYIADKVIEIDTYNPMAASSLVSSFSQMKRVMSTNRKRMNGQLSMIRNTKGISNNVFEIVDKIINQT